MFASKTLKSALVALVAFSSFGLSACKGRVSGVTATASTAPTTAPADFYAPTGGNSFQENTAPVIQAVANAQIGTVPVTGWQAKGIAVSGGTMYVSAFGTTKLVFTSGTVLKIGSDGKVKDFGSNAVGYHSIAKTVEGISISGSTLFVADASAMYSVDATSGKVTTVKGTGGKDVAATAAGVFVANGSVDKADSKFGSRSPVAGLSATGGVGADSTGNVYAVSGNTIKKADVSGQVMDVVTSDLSAPIDVAVDNRNGDLYVLDQSEIKRFNSSGSLLVKFPSGATTPAAITTDESGMVYVADTGTSKKDSKIIKFSASTDNASSSSSSMSYSSSGGSTSISSVDYSAYSRRR